MRINSVSIKLKHISLSSKIGVLGTGAHSKLCIPRPADHELQINPGSDICKNTLYIRILEYWSAVEEEYFLKFSEMFIKT